MGWPQRSTCPQVRQVVSSHADQCRLRLRSALMTHENNWAGIVSNRIMLTQAEQKRFTIWRRAGLSRLDAMRIVCDLSMSRGLA
jgi:hypothetical protein